MWLSVYNKSSSTYRVPTWGQWVSLSIVSSWKRIVNRTEGLDTQHIFQFSSFDGSIKLTVDENLLPSSGLK